MLELLNNFIVNIKLFKLYFTYQKHIVFEYAQKFEIGENF